MDKVRDFTSKISQWNKVTFGNIFHRKMRLLARLGGIQQAVEVKLTRSLGRLERKLKNELKEVLTHEELY